MLYSSKYSGVNVFHNASTTMPWTTDFYTESQMANDTEVNRTLSTQYVCLFEPEEEFFSPSIFQICICLMYSIIFVSALLGNGLVCFVVQTSPRMKTVTNFFIMNLAVGDVLMTLFCVPFSFVSVLVLRYWPFGAVMCKVVNYTQAVSVLVSAYTLLAISIDRYMVITRPLKPRLGKAAAKLVVFAVWCGALATAAPIMIVSQLQKPSLWHEVCQLDVCGEQWANSEQNALYTYALLFLQFALPLSALVCTYARIAYVVWAVRPPGEAECVRDMRIHNSKRKMVKMMVTVVAVFTVCWLPLNVFIVLWTVHENDEEWSTWPGMPYVWFASHWLAMSHSCYNPVIYCYMNARYRHGFKQVFSTMLCLNVNEARRSFHRSSIICEGLPLSEMVGVNGSMTQQSQCSKCHGMRGSYRGAIQKCACSSRKGQTPNPNKPTSVRITPPARALSVRSHFS